MASPQKEQGYTPIANEILEKLCHPGITGSEYRVLLVVIRKTYGFQKKKDYISLSQFELCSDMKRNKVVETIASLVSKQILIKQQSFYTLNKDWEKWVVTKRVVPNRGSTQTGVQVVPNRGSKVVPNRVHTKERKKVTKETSKTSVLQGDQWQVLINLFEPLNPLYEDFYRNTTERNALEAMSVKFGYDRLVRTIEALPGIVSQPYAPKITKPSELKRDLGKLLLFVKQNEISTFSKTNAVAHIS